MNKTRKQLTLFLSEQESILIKEIRRRFNPKQFELIKSHITLCREDEIVDIEKVSTNLSNLEYEVFEMKTGRVKRVSDQNGVLIPLNDKNQCFQNLRETVLKDVHKNPRHYEPHITIMHPRNSTCEDHMFEEIMNIELPKKVTIEKISLIEQEIGKEWVVIDEYTLGDGITIK